MLAKIDLGLTRNRNKPRKTSFHNKRRPNPDSLCLNVSTENQVKRRPSNLGRKASEKNVSKGDLFEQLAECSGRNQLGKDEEEDVKEAQRFFDIQAHVNSRYISLMRNFVAMQDEVVKNVCRSNQNRMPSIKSTQEADRKFLTLFHDQLRQDRIKMAKDRSRPTDVVR